MDLSRTLRRLLGTRGEPRPFARLERNVERAQQSVWLFYLLSAIVAYMLMVPLHQDAMIASELDYTWPVEWLRGTDLVHWADILSLSTLLFALLACWKPELTVARVVFAVTLLLCGGLGASFGGVSHLYHAWFWTAAVFAFLPRPNGRAGKLSYCLTFATAQGLILAFYSLAGLWKVFYGLLSLWGGSEGNFSPRGLALTLADRIMQTGTEPLLGRFFVENYWLALPLFIGLIYIQFFAVVVTYRPRLHVIWGLALIGFHIGTWLLMEIVFPLHVMLLLVLFVLSPFRKDNWLDWATVAELPLIGSLFRAARITRARRPAIIPAE